MTWKKITHEYAGPVEDHADEHSGEIDALKQFLSESLPFIDTEPLERRLHLAKHHRTALVSLQNRVKNQRGVEALPTDHEIYAAHEEIQHDDTQSHDHSSYRYHKHILPILERLQELQLHIDEKSFKE